jgi:hypothetical protein
MDGTLTPFQLLMHSSFERSSDNLGFCEWSAICEATDAFSLLDHFNSTFDRLVNEYKLSKVSCSENKDRSLFSNKLL